MHINLFYLFSTVSIQVSPEHVIVLDLLLSIIFFLTNQKNLHNIPHTIHRSSFWPSFFLFSECIFYCFSRNVVGFLLNLCPNHPNLAFIHAVCRTRSFLVLFIVFSLRAKCNILTSSNSRYVFYLFVSGTFLIHKLLIHFFFLL